jgi:hypothetical protein
MNEAMAPAAREPGWAEQVWADYQRTHDVSAHDGQTVAVDSATGDVVFGSCVPAIVEARRLAGLQHPLIFVRLSQADYLLQRKRIGGRWRRVQ